MHIYIYGHTSIEHGEEVGQYSQPLGIAIHILYEGCAEPEKIMGTASTADARDVYLTDKIMGTADGNNAKCYADLDGLMLSCGSKWHQIEVPSNLNVSRNQL